MSHLIADAQAPASSPLDRSRLEHRLLLTELEAGVLEAAVAQRLPLRFFPGGGRTRVVTVYLDRPDGRLCARALARRGAMSRVRLKLYRPVGTGGRPFPLVALELKRRRGPVTRKDRIWCLPATLPVLLAGRAVPVPVIASPAAAVWRRVARLAVGASPACMVAYERRVFEAVDGSVRVTLDRALGCAPCDGGLLAELARGRPVFVPPRSDAPVVAELKHTGELPGWLAAIASPEHAEFSKLTWALGQLARRGMP